MLSLCDMTGKLSACKSGCWLNFLKMCGYNGFEIVKSGS